MNKKYLIIGIVSTLIMCIGVTYAYFTSEIIGSGKSVVIESDSLSVIFTDTTPEEIIANNSNIRPGWDNYSTFTIENKSDEVFYYNLYIKNLVNTFVTEGFLQYKVTCNNNGYSMNDYVNVPKQNGGDYLIKKNISIENNVIQTCRVDYRYLDSTTVDQSDDMGKTFSGTLIIEGYQKPVKECTYDGTLAQGSEFVDGQYTYRYMQKRNGYYEEGTYNFILTWVNMEEDGWEVALTNATSTDPVTTELCTSINNKPVVSMPLMFYGSQATSIDLSSFDTSKVTDMSNMFCFSQATDIYNIRWYGRYSC